MDKILKTVILNHVTHSDGDISCYDFTVTIKENDFKFENVQEEVDFDRIELSMNGNDISTENFKDMLFDIDGKIKCLGRVFTECNTSSFWNEIEEWVKCDCQEALDDEHMFQELSSPYLTGRA